MSTAVLGKKVRRNVPRRNDRKKSADGGAMVGGLVWGLGRTVVTFGEAAGAHGRLVALGLTPHVTAAPLPAGRPLSQRAQRGLQGGSRPL